ncbi:MAG: hypothetical protein WCF60_14370 [Anaerobacillus sp.]
MSELMMGKRKWVLLLIVMGVAFITFKLIGDEKKPSAVVQSVESRDDIVPYFKTITPGLDLAMQSGNYQEIERTVLPDEFKVNVDGVWYSRYNLSVFYHVDVSGSKFVLSRDIDDLPKIDRLVVEHGSGETSLLELVETEEGVLFEGSYYMKGTFQAVTDSKVNQPVKEVVGSIKTIVSGKQSAIVNIPLSYEYDKEKKKTVSIDETKKFEGAEVTVSEWQETPSDSRLLLEIESPYKEVVQMELTILTPEGSLSPLLFEQVANEKYTASFPKGTELPEDIHFYGLTASSSEEIVFDVDPNQYEIYKQIKQSTYEDRIDEPVMTINGSEVVKEGLFYDDHGVTFHILFNKVASHGPYVNLMDKDHLMIEAVNEKNEVRNIRPLGDEQERVTFMIDRGFYERSKKIQVKVTNLPVFVNTNWVVNLSNE